MSAYDNAAKITTVGDGRRVRVRTNSGVLCVVGNGADVVVERNEGTVCVVGNNGRVVVACNAGVLKYTGNDGCVCAQRGEGRVKLSGNDIHFGSQPCRCSRGTASAPTPFYPAAWTPAASAHAHVHTSACSRKDAVRISSKTRHATVNVSVQTCANGQQQSVDRWCQQLASGLLFVP